MHKVQDYLQQSCLSSDMSGLVFHSHMENTCMIASFNKEGKVGTVINIEKTEGAIKNGQSRDIGNIGYTRHRTKTKKPKKNPTRQKTKKINKPHHFLWKSLP